jgi:hypothetical protein
MEAQQMAVVETPRLDRLPELSALGKPLPTNKMKFFPEQEFCADVMAGG